MPQSATNLSQSAGAGFPSNDYHRLPVTEKQLQFARAIAQRAGVSVPSEAEQDRQALSQWISENRTASPGGPCSQYPSSKQVAFAERIARLKKRTVPDECFCDQGLMSKWIDHNL